MTVTPTPMKHPHRGLTLVLWLLATCVLLLAFDVLNVLMHTVPSSTMGIDPSIGFSIGVPLRVNG